jgi:cytochrome oxidase assembly protein ShyY1
MLRTLFSPRLVGLHLLTIGVLISFTLLGRWQLGVFEDSGRPRAAADPAPVAVTGLTRPGRTMTVDAVSRRVTAQGTYDAARQLLVADRTADSSVPGGRASKNEGLWVLTALVLPDSTAIPVVRGWVASAGDPAVAAVPRGTVTVTGRLQASEQTDSVQRGGAQLPAGQVATVSTAELINLWTGARLRDGYVIAAGQAPASAPLPRPVAAAPPAQPGGFTWRNLAYAAQWWIFAVFAVFMWFHFVRDAVRARRPGSPEGAPGEPTGVQAGYRERPDPLTR